MKRRVLSRRDASPLPCEPPLERLGDGLIVIPECEQCFEGGEGVDVVRLEDLSLHVGEVDLDLGEPGGVDRRVDEGHWRARRCWQRSPRWGAAIADHPDDSGGGAGGFPGRHVADPA